MTYGNSWVALANRALGRLGRGRIDSLISGDEMAQYVNTFLGEAVESVLGSRHWSIAKRAELAQLADVPVYGYEYAYQLPSGIIGIIEVDSGGYEYKPEGDTILTDAEEVYVTYTARPESPADLPSYIEKAIATNLAFLLSAPLTSSEQLSQRMAQEAQAAMTEAISADARRFQKQEAEPWFDEARG